MTSSYNFNKKYVFVTGSTLGIGRSIAECFLRAGATVAIHGRSQDKVHKAVKELNELKTSGQAVGVYGDLADKDGYKSIIAQVDRHGDVDILVNNAGIFEMGTLEGQTDDSFARMMQVNVLSVFGLARHFMPKMLKKKDGRVINIGSVAGMTSAQAFIGYSTSKGALDALTRNLAAYTKGTRVTVNSIAVGAVDTEGIHSSLSKETYEAWKDSAEKSTYIGRVLSPSEVAKVVLFIASDDGVVVNGAAQRAESGLLKQF